MFYEERLIDNVWHCRTQPNGKWRVMTDKQLTFREKELQGINEWAEQEGTMKLYYHKTDGGAEYLMDTYMKCSNGHKEGVLNDKTKYVVRIDGDITKDAELSIR